ncbi:S-adenosyl-L-methionine-dependent methyltransferase [Setomelanomma holmii]|uniref:S-adenosyl-L-methionine-dependent methyltransferase n=1 Tax=Setomelanomma holmii TaxID=210430 RepID=A0A9P4LK97_9PLEO|nr:S-adenosyl-L-methionine-dependent methyltransferase [Setomelanomma holmii]
MVVTAKELDAGAIMDCFEERPINKRSREKLAKSIRERLELVGMDRASSSTEIKMLDYACGDGFLSRLFAPQVSSITAIDVSPTMIEKYKAKIDELGPSQKSTMAFAGNLLSDPLEPSTLADERLNDFHLITVGAALHHFPSSEDAVRRLAKRLRPGGILYIQDLFDDGHQEGTDRKGPRGFTLDELRSILSNAELVNFRFEVLPEALEVELPSEEVLKVRFFVARAMKPKVE